MKGPGSRAEILVAALFGLTTLAGLGLFAVYFLGGQTQLEGVLLCVALGSMGIGVIIWAHDLMTTVVAVDELHSLATSPAQAADLEAALNEEAGFTRRRLLVGMLLAATGGLAAALVVPVLSLGPAPGAEQFSTSWRNGKRLVDENGQPIEAAAVEVDSLVTVFPEDDVGSATSQAVLIRVPPGALALTPERLAGAPDGFVVYSKICTHAGCPVGLYRDVLRQLVCPCHQSTFDVVSGANPVSGPAARALPQLPIKLQPDGTFIATGDFPEPVGPGFWNMTQ